MRALSFIFVFTSLMSFTLTAQDSELKIPTKQLSKFFEKGYVLEVVSIPSNLHKLSEGTYYHVTHPTNFATNAYVYIGRVKTCRAGGCNIQNTSSNGNSEYFDYFIIYNHYLVIQSVSIYDYQATHGYEMTNSTWLKQFKGYDGTKELVYGEDIDAIAGATISGNAALADIEHKTKLLKQISAKKL